MDAPARRPQRTGQPEAELVRCPPAAPLRGPVLGYRGFRIGVRRTRQRLMLPDGIVKLMIGFGDPVRVVDAVDPRQDVRAVSMANPVRVRAAVGEHTGSLHGVTVLLTPLAGYRLFRVPMAEWSDLALDPADLLGPVVGQLSDRLAELPCWADRFALLDRVLATWLAEGPVPSPEVVHAWRELRRTGGRIRVEELAAETGWSRRTLERRFRQQIGHPPKAVAQIVRLQGALRLLEAGGSCARAAAEAGYHDQAHFDHTFRAMTGRTPGQFRRARAHADPADPSDFVPDQVTSVLLAGARG
ncbi:helix-turn-helix domain-containing protein [Streptantibioticus cattleyicolor]|uniref:Transcriptional regulator n=1 Tax=Streptantibioticus cattleyicolor (strain ATCC 35852 / DSM 46488 / JCM 4925 / NBRC 14057 / NRRL 8057) TaxID=1003195 RepID=F8JN06_STREN|nr:helix-turn-helix transcriptional regulator [Streptantibioticus cattleyicolor]AEW98338.1 transcriptional regulator [Streptantibioticus cattleyicolor NRRL 8057 = DSM 46488]CCB72604.1 Transcriptional regulator [Streptantibioticus cattleyicolor NRRL 8057 = DSM 46488]